MINEAGKITTFIQQTQALWAVLLGMFVQFWFGDRRGLKVAITIAISSMFVAFFFVPAIVDVLNAIAMKLFDFKIESDSNIAIMLYASSSLISIEFIAILIRFLPKTAERKITKYLGVEDATDSE